MSSSRTTLLQQALRHAPGGLLTFSDDGVVLFASERLHEWAGAVEGALVGRPVDTLWTAGARTAHREQLLAPLLRLGKADEVFLNLQTASGDEIPVIVSAARDTSGTQPLNHCVLMASWRRRQAEQTAASKDGRLATIAHDLRTPLSAILGWVRVARSGKLDSPALAKALDTVERNAKAQSRLIENLLDESPLPEDANAGSPTVQAKDIKQHKAKAQEKVSIKGVRVLVVDDDQDARSLLKVLLEDAGATVATAASSEEALDRLALEGVPDVLLSDVGMPGRDGFELIREVRSSRMPWSKTIAAIAVTGRARPQDRVDLLRAGYQAHLCKPVEPAEVVAMVKALARPR